MKDLAARSDVELVRATRTGDRDAFAVLWQRHSHAAATLARSYTHYDTDDVVAEAFTLVYTAIRKGGGPTTAFRPYLFTTLRNVAAGWGRADHTLNVEDIDALSETPAEEDTLDGLDRSLTVTAFRALPTRWQEVLWYMDVESLAPRQVGPLLGMKPNAVSALAIRAREGLRLAWIRTHLASTTTAPACRRTIEAIPAWSRGTLAGAARRQVAEHLAGCTQCQAVADEAAHVNRRLALILLPLTAGLAGATAYLASAPGAGISAAVLPASPTVPWATATAASGTTAARIGAISGIAAIGTSVVAAGGLLVALALGQPAVDAAAETAALAPPTSAAGASSLGATSSEAAGDGNPETRPTPAAPDLPTTPGPDTGTGGASPDATPPVEQPAVPAEAHETAPGDEVAPTPSASDQPVAAVPAANPPATDPPAPDVPLVVDPTPATAPTVPSAPIAQLAARPTTVLPAIAGTSKPAAVVTVVEQGGTGTWSTVASAAGEWSVELTGLHPGTWSVDATQTVVSDGVETTSPASTPVSVLLTAPPTGNVAVVTAGALYTITADGVPGQTFHFTIPSAGFVSSDLTFDAAGHWEPDGPVYLSGTDVLFSYLSGPFAGPAGQATVTP